MDTLKKNEIYDRLFAIRFEIDPKPIPDPAYINRKIGECHVLIDEMEKVHIQLSKEISIYQRSYNDAVAQYEYSKETLIANDPGIKNLPSIKDREAKANQALREELSAIKNYKNEISDLNTLIGEVNLKIKNLNRANMDIKMQLRAMEAQLKLGQAPAGDKVQSRMLEAFGRSLIHQQDSLTDSESEVSKTIIEDPSDQINVNEVFAEESASEQAEEESNEEESSTDEVAPETVDPDSEPGSNFTNPEEDPGVEPVESGVMPEIEQALLMQEVEQAIENETVVDMEKVLLDDTNPVTVYGKEESGTQAVAAEANKAESQIPETGKEQDPKSDEIVSKTVSDGPVPSPSAPAEKTSVGGIDIDSLLVQYN